MKRKFRIENLCCANCAAKMEHAISKLEGVECCTISFMTQRLTLEGAEDSFDKLVEQAEAIIRRIEPDCRLTK